MRKFESIENKDTKIPLILKLDATGYPIRWLNWKEAVVLEFTDKVSWRLGQEAPIVLHGGHNKEGLQSIFELAPIIACVDQTASRRKSKAPTLTNRELFRRDGHLCLYCGDEFSSQKLTRDHVHPLSRGGLNTWNNVVAACKRCNHKKGAKTVEEAGLKLLAVPYTPSPSAFLILQNRRIIGCQMEYLKAKITPSELQRLKMS